MKVKITAIATAQNIDTNLNFVEYTARGEFAGKSVELNVSSFDLDDAHLRLGDTLEVSVSINRISVGFETLTTVKEILL